MGFNYITNNDTDFMLQQESVVEEQDKTQNEFTNYSTKTLFTEKTNSMKISFKTSRPKYPDFRFSCPNCGTLDVLIEFQPTKNYSGLCLECDMKWREVSNK